MTRPHWLCWLALMLAAFLAGLATVRRTPDRAAVAALPPVLEATETAAPPQASEAPPTVEARLEEKLAAALAAAQPQVPEDFSGPFSGERLLELAARASSEDQTAQDDMSRYAMAWARTDPGGMWAYFARRGSFSIPLGPQPQDHRTAVGVGGFLLPSWLEQDRAACLAAAKAAPRGLLDETDMHQLSGALWENAPEEALALLARQFEGKPYFGKNWFRLDQLSEEQARERFALVRALPEGEARARLAAAFLLGPTGHYSKLNEELWAGLGAAEQTALFEAGYAPAPGKPGYAESYQYSRAKAEADPSPVVAVDFLRWHGPEWAREDLPAAMAWAKTHLSGESRAREVAAMLHDGFENAPQAAAREVAAMPEGSWRDAVLGFMAGKFVPFPGEEILKEQPWFKTLSEEDREASIKWASDYNQSLLYSARRWRSGSLR